MILFPRHSSKTFESHQTSCASCEIQVTSWSICLITEHPSSPSASKLFSLQQDASAWCWEPPAKRSCVGFFQNTPLPSFAHLSKSFLLFWGHWDSSCSSNSGQPPTQNGYMGIIYRSMTRKHPAPRMFRSCPRKPWKIFDGRNHDETWENRLPSEVNWKVSGQDRRLHKIIQVSDCERFSVWTWKESTRPPSRLSRLVLLLQALLVTLVALWPRVAHH